MAKKTVGNTGKPGTATVYVGCPLPGLLTYTVFKGGELPEHVKQMIAEDENVGNLIVPVENLQIARKNINQKGHWLNICAEKLKNKKLKKED